MKKVLMIFSIALSYGISAQSSIGMQLYDSLSSDIYYIPNNGIIHIKTKANKNSATDVDFTNLGSISNRYKVKRLDVLLNTDALANFCFAGNCYPDNILVSNDTITLAPGQSLAQLSEITGDFELIKADLVEGPVVGKSTIDYTIFNVDVPSDKVTFTLKYNAPEAVGIKENVKNLSDFSIFPNPAKESAVINLNSAKAMQSSLSVYNALGEVVLQKDLSLLEGKNKIELNTEILKSGIYFVSIANGSNSISKKLIIN